MTIYLKDSFTGADGTLLTGRSGDINANWVSNVNWGSNHGNADEFVIRNNCLQRADFDLDPTGWSGGEALLYSTSAPKTDAVTGDWDVTFKLRFLTGLDNSFLTLYFNADPADGTGPSTADQIFCIGNVGGVSFLWYVNFEYPWVVETDYQIKLTLRGNTLALYVNGAIVVSDFIRPGEEMHGRLGIDMFNRSGTTCLRIDDFLWQSTPEQTLLVDELYPTTDGDDISTHTANSGSQWGADSGTVSFVSVPLYQGNGGFAQTVGTTGRAAASTVTFASNGDVFGEYVFSHVGSATPAWITGVLLFNYSTGKKLGAVFRYLGGSTDLWAYLDSASPTAGIYSLAGTPSALTGGQHTVRYELVSGQFTVWLDGVQIYTVALTGVDITGYRVRLQIQSASTADTKLHRVQAGKLVYPPPVIPPFWTNFVLTQETP